MDMLKQNIETDQATAIASVKPVHPHFKLVRKGGILSIGMSNPVPAKCKAHLIINKQT